VIKRRRAREHREQKLPATRTNSQGWKLIEKGRSMDIEGRRANSWISQEKNQEKRVKKGES